MARLVTEGFEDATLQNDPGVLVGGIGINPGGRRGSYCLTSSTYPYNIRAYRFALDTNPTEVWVRFAFHFGPNLPAMTLVSLGTVGADEVRVNTGGLGNPLNVTVGGNTITGTTAIYGGTWYMVEVHYKLHSSNGQVELRVEGLPEGQTITGNTAPGGSTAITSMYLWGEQWGSQWVDYDDVAINDSSSGETGWCRDGYVIALLPNAAGASNQWLRDDTGVADSGNYTRANQRPPDDASSYVYSQNVGDVDLYNVGDLSGLNATDTIRRVWVSTYASEPVAGGDAFQIGLRIGSTNYWSSDKLLITAWKRFVSQIYEANPSNSAAWTQSDVNSLQVGVKVS